MSISPILLDDIALTWADGSPCLTRASAAFGPGLHGIIGANGTGKTTLIRLITGNLTPDSGQVTAPSRISVLKQDLGLHTEASLAQILGVDATWDALQRISDGEVHQELFDRVGDDWDLPERIVAHLERAGLDQLTQAENPEALMDRRIGTLSGGEAVRAALVGAGLNRPEALLLDEPTNNLDGEARSLLLEDLTSRWANLPVLVVSHDRDLLRRCETITELIPAEHTRGNRAVPSTLRTVHGGYDQWREHLDAEQRTAQRRVREASAEFTREKRERIQQQTRLAHAERAGRKVAQEARYPPLAAGNKKAAAENSAARARSISANREQAASEALSAAQEQVRSERNVYLSLPETAVPTGRKVLELQNREDSQAAPVILTGAERLRVAGRNGSGKSTLLRQILEGPEPTETTPPNGSHFTVRFRTERVGWVPQRISLDPEATVESLVSQANPDASDQQIRNGLARLLFRRDRIHTSAHQLSGGERFRVALAQQLLTEPAPQLLLLDEPTNNLDLPTVDWLIAALQGYRGALVIISHDEDFLQQVSVDHTLELPRPHPQIPAAEK